MSARKKTLTEATTAEIAASVVLINIDKEKQRMTVFVDGVEQYDWPVSTGLRGYSTPEPTPRGP
jgi:lipoprotein-anchoring transpeptidase ErfK/SrfK